MSSPHKKDKRNKRSNGKIQTFCASCSGTIRISSITSIVGIGYIFLDCRNVIVLSILEK
jgi:hypothetical protein